MSSKISLIIPVFNEYGEIENFFNELKKCNFDLIDEIIISDENGNDAKKIQRDFPNNNKIIINVNSRKLGPFLNKLTCCKLAKNEWITLIVKKGNNE